MSQPANPVSLPLAQYQPRHFLLEVEGRVATRREATRREGSHRMWDLSNEPEHEVAEP